MDQQSSHTNNTSSWRDKISNAAQLGGIETSVLDNGAGRGTRIAWVNTGTGFRFKVVLDRGMDIADAFFNQHSLAWLSHVGVTNPQPLSGKGIDWLKTFGGGLVTTCGLSHIGGPEKDEYGERGVHGGISNTAATIESIIQPDPVAGKMTMSITGTMKETTVFGPSLELRRTITSTLGEARLTIHDEVINRGNTPAPHMLLYHCNFGWPLLDEGTQILWQGKWQPRDPATAVLFTPQHDFKTCPAPLASHAGTGEEVAFIDPAADADGNCACGLHNPSIGLAVALRFQKKELPSLTNWQHWGKQEYVLGLEPGTHYPIGQAKARAQNQLIFLAPGETKNYTLVIDVLHRQAHISDFLKQQELSATP